MSELQALVDGHHAGGDCIAETIIAGESLAGTLANGGCVSSQNSNAAKLYEFTVDETAAIYDILMATPGSVITPKIFLLEENGTKVAESNGGNQYGAAIFQLHQLSPGTYTIECTSDNGDVGDFDVTLTNLLAPGVPGPPAPGPGGPPAPGPGGPPAPPAP